MLGPARISVSTAGGRQKRATGVTAIHCKNHRTREAKDSREKVKSDFKIVRGNGLRRTACSTDARKKIKVEDQSRMEKRILRSKPGRISHNKKQRTEE